MATKSLGRLTLDLIARIGGFTGPMDQAAREAQRRSKQIERSMKTASNAIKTVVGALAAGVTFNKIIKETVAFENAQAQLAAVLRSTGEAAGYSRDQLNDMAAGMSRTSILSQSEINDAQTTLLAFTGIVGEEFPRALQAAIDMASRTGMSVVSASETIGRALDIPSRGLTALSRQGFRFSDDQKKLAEYLESTGRTAEAQGLILEALEESYGGAAQAARDTLGGALKALSNEFGTLMTGESGLESVTAAVNDLTDTLADPRVKEAFDTIVAGVIGVAAAAAKALPAIMDFTMWAAEELASLAGGIADDDIVRLEQRADKLREILDTPPIAKVSGSAPILSLAKIAYDELSGVNKEAARELAEIQEKISRYYATVPSLPARGSGSSAGRGGQDEAALIEEARLAAIAKKAAEDAAAAAEKSEKQRLESIAKEISALERAAATWGMTADQVKIYGLETQGATAAQIAHAQSLLDTVSEMEKSKKSQEDYLRLVQDLRTDEEKLTDQMRERLAVLDSIKNITDDERNKTASRIASSAFSSAPEFGGLAPEIGGPFGELNKIDDAQKELQNWYDTQLEMLDKYRTERSDLNAQWDEQEANLKREHEERLANIERARTVAQLSAAESAFSSLSEMAKQFAGEQSKTYRALFAIEKAVAIARAIVAINTGLAQAAANPWPTNLAAMASVAAATAGIVSTIASANISGQAHDGIMSIPEDGTWNLKKGERVTTAETSAKLDATLDRINRGGGNNSGVVVNLMESKDRAGRVEEGRGPNNEEIINIWVADLMGDGKTATAIQRKFQGMRAAGR